MRELHCPTKTEQQLALGGWHSADALAPLLYMQADTFSQILFYVFVITSILFSN